MLYSIIKLSENFLSNLLPYDLSDKKNGDIKSSLCEYKMLLESLKNVVYDFKKCNLEKFDGLVGENACQIRAAWLSLILDHAFVNKSDIIVNISRIQKNIDKLLAEDIARIMHEGISLAQLFFNKVDDLEIILNRAEMFLLQIYLLNISKGEATGSLCGKEISDHKRLKKFGEVSSNFTKNLLSKLRKITSIDSENFIREQALELNRNDLVAMTSGEFVYKHNNLNCIPMFWTYKVVLELFKKRNIPIVIHVKFLADEKGTPAGIEDEYLLFKYEQVGQEYRFVQQLAREEDLEKAVCVVEGVCVTKDGALSGNEWIAQMENYCLESIVLAGAADHRQYPDSAQDAIIDKLNDPEYKMYKEMAVREGFSLQNPTKFFIRHVYAMRLDRITQLVETVDAEVATMV